MSIILKTGQCFLTYGQLQVIYWTALWQYQKNKRLCHINALKTISVLNYLIVKTNEQINCWNVEQTVQQKTSVCGFHGRSILKHFPWNEFHVNCTTDYIHIFLLLILKKMITLWIDGSSFEQPIFFLHKLKEIDRTLEKHKNPYIIYRTLREIHKNLNHWKALEFRSFLLYYRLP